MEWWGNSYSFASLDPDAAAYIAAVEAADGQALEDAVKNAINTFVIGCKADDIWRAIKTCCIVAGARTLTGALTPLVGAAPTNVGFASGDYNRKTGLKSNGTTYLETNRAGNADPQNSKHFAIYKTEPVSSGAAFFGTGNDFGGTQAIGGTFRVNTNSGTSYPPGFNEGTTGFFGIGRQSASEAFAVNFNTAGPSTQASVTPSSANQRIFDRTAGSGGNGGRAIYRLSYYSIGEWLDMTLLRTRLNSLMSDLTAAIP